MSDERVVDDPGGSRFVSVIDGHTAELVYRRVDDRLVLVHTGVPDELGGRGVGGNLVAASIDRAESEGLTVVPECPFARGWLERHPDVSARVEISWP